MPDYPLNKNVIEIIGSVVCFSFFLGSALFRVGSVDASLDQDVPFGFTIYETGDRTTDKNYRTDGSVNEIRFNKFSF